MTRHAITLLLGAGFSKSIFPQMPTMPELTGIVFKDHEVEGLIRQLDKQGALFDGRSVDKINIESWFQVLEESSAYIKDTLLVERRRLLVTTAMKVIACYIQEISKNIEMDEDTLDGLEKLIRSGVNILTTNYDLVFEIALMKLIDAKRIDIGTPYDLNHGFIEMAYQLKTASYLTAGSSNAHKYSRIYKLHGSCDWYTQVQNSSEKIYADTSLISWGLLKNYDEDSNFAIQNMRIVMAGPTNFKRESINSQALKSIWTGSFAARKHTSILFIYGSSLHSTDAALTSLIMEGLPVNSQVKIFDLSSDEVSNRVKQIAHKPRVSVAPADQINYLDFISQVCLYAAATKLNSGL